MVLYVNYCRIWYLTNVIPSPSRGARNTPIIYCQTFPARPTETFTQLLTRVNERLTEKVCSGLCGISFINIII